MTDGDVKIADDDDAIIAYLERPTAKRSCARRGYVPFRRPSSLGARGEKLDSRAVAAQVFDEARERRRFFAMSAAGLQHDLRLREIENRETGVRSASWLQRAAAR